MAPAPTTPSGPSSGPSAGSGTRPYAWMELVYLGLALAGAVFPWLANLDYMRASGGTFNLGDFVAQAQANPAAASLSRDLAIGATAVVIWMVREARRLKMRGLGWVLLSCVTVAFAFAAPLSLYLRERRLAELGRQGQQDPPGPDAL